MPRRVFVVDDDPILRELLCIHLREAGYDVAEFGSALEAGYEVIARPPDLLIVDVMMPHMDGFEFVAALRSDSSVPPFPVLFLTAERDGEGRARELGAVGYIMKPVLADRLLDAVGKALVAR